MNKNASKYFDNICLIGMPASGKTTFGKIYAFHSKRNFLDFDRFIESNIKKSIEDVFEKKGEDHFRELETKMLRKIERRRDHVIALGGGTLLRQENFELARKIGLIVWLKTPLETLAERIFAEKNSDHKVKRPLFKDCKTLEQIQEKINELWEFRKDSYEKADIILDTKYSSLDTLKLQLALVERKAANPKYVKDVLNIMNS